MRKGLLRMYLLWKSHERSSFGLIQLTAHMPMSTACLPARPHELRHSSALRLNSHTANPSIQSRYIHNHLSPHLTSAAGLMFSSPSANVSPWVLSCASRTSFAAVPMVGVITTTPTPW